MSQTAIGCSAHSVTAIDAASPALRREPRWLGEEIRSELRDAREWPDWLQRAANLATRQMAATAVFLWNSDAKTPEERLEGLCFPATGLAAESLRNIQDVAQQAHWRQQVVVTRLELSTDLHVAAISLRRGESDLVLLVLVNSQVAARTTAAWWLPQVASCAELWSQRESQRSVEMPTPSVEPLKADSAVKSNTGPASARISHSVRWSLVALTAAVALIIPVPYEITCECELQPVTRRFVAAPFEGTLERALVEVGDTVHAGQLLALMDGREVRWEMAGNVAEYERAGKERDALLADQKFGEAQVAKLQMDRLALTGALWEHRHQNLEIRSPIDGIVVSGELKRAEGVRLSLGQSLFEVAPLNQLIVEVEIPESEFAHVPIRTTAEIRLEAFPHDELHGTLDRVCPRAELRHKQQVFIGEIALPNEAERLRPGMRGRVSLAAGRTTLGWRLFHRAAGKFRMWWGA